MKTCVIKNFVVRIGQSDTANKFFGLIYNVDIISSKSDKKEIDMSVLEENTRCNIKTIIELENPPVEPDSDECCGNGCQRCVWTVYNETLEAYRNKKELCKDLSTTTEE